MFGWLKDRSKNAQEGNTRRTIELLTKAATTAEQWAEDYGSTSPADVKRVKQLQQALYRDLIGPTPIQDLCREYLDPLLEDETVTGAAKAAVASVFDVASEAESPGQHQSLSNHRTKLSFPPEEAALDVPEEVARAHDLVADFETPVADIENVKVPPGSSADECRSALVIAVLSEILSQKHDLVSLIRRIRKSELLYRALGSSQSESSRGFRYYFERIAYRIQADDVLFMESMLNNATHRGKTDVSLVELFEHTARYDAKHIADAVVRVEELHGEDRVRFATYLKARNQRMRTRLEKRMQWVEQDAGA